MCFALHFFTDENVEEREFDNKNPRMWIQKEIDVSMWAVDNRNVYYIGSSQKCGCGWRRWDEREDDDTEKLEKQKDREALFKLLAGLNLGDSHLIICWRGEEGKVTREEILDIAKLKDITFDLEECVNYKLKYEIE